MIHENIFGHPQRIVLLLAFLILNNVSLEKLQAVFLPLYFFFSDVESTIQQGNHLKNVAKPGLEKTKTQVGSLVSSLLHPETMKR